MRTARYVTTDPRGRVSVGRPDQSFLLHEEEDGTLVLEPAVVMSELERRYLANAAVQAQIEHARSHPEERVPRRRRTR